MAPVQASNNEAQQVVGNDDDEYSNVASVLAIGTANPDNFIYQSDYPDFYFRVTNSEHLTTLKDKFKRICENSMVRKRHFHLTEEILKANPELTVYGATSLNARQDMNIVEIPKQAERAAMAAIQEWGRPKADITHILVNSSSGYHLPGCDYQLVKSLGLSPSTKRFMLFHQGCFAGATVLRLAKDLAENNPGSRILIVCSELNINPFCGPHEGDLSNLVVQAIFGEGTAASIVGVPSATCPEAESPPLFRLVRTLETILPGTDGAIEGSVRESGLAIKLSSQVPQLIGENIVACLETAMPGVKDWNQVFWVPHPGGAAIMRAVEKRAGLGKEKLRAAWHVLAEYGNMCSACVFFIMDEMRKRSVKEGRRTTGEGLDWGLMLGFGPGITVETIVLKSVRV